MSWLLKLTLCHYSSLFRLLYDFIKVSVMTMSVVSRHLRVSVRLDADGGRYWTHQVGWNRGHGHGLVVVQGYMHEAGREAAHF